MRLAPVTGPQDISIHFSYVHFMAISHVFVPVSCQFWIVGRVARGRGGDEEEILNYRPVLWPGGWN